MLKYVDRRGTDCNKWDGQIQMFGEEGLMGLWVADMDFQVADCIQEALQQYVAQGVFGYMCVREDYYKACIDWEYKHHGYKMEKEWIRFSPGVVSGINWVVQMMTKEGDAVLVNTPVYYPFLNAVTNNHRKLVTSDLINENGTYRIDFEDFEEKIIKEEVKLFILCSPHNPVSRVWTREELVKMLDICKKHNVFVISDEIHQDLVFGEQKHIPAASLKEYDSMLITFVAASKTFNLAACQNSEVIIPDEKIRKIWDEYVNQIRVVYGNGFGYIAVEAGYKGGEDWLQEVKKQIYTNYECLKEIFAKKLPKVVVSPLEGTYLAWVDLREYVSPEQVKEVVQKGAGLAVDYGEWFGGDRFKGWIRINLATSLENIQTACDRLCDEIKKQL